ncbi:MAG: aldo/keto reductase [Bacteroidota bacterium]
MHSARRKFLKQSSLAALGFALSDPVIRSASSSKLLEIEGTIPKRILGKTNLAVTIIGLGGWHIGRLKSEETAQTIVHQALDLGINFFDTAASYQNGVSEMRYGKALKGRRDKIILMSKSTMRTKADARRELELSLRHLQTDYLDVWQLHSIQAKEDVKQIFSTGGAYETAAKAKQEGLVRHIGITGHFDPETNLEALHYHDLLETIQMPINPVDPHSRSFIKTVLPKAIEHNLGVLAMKTIANGRIVEHGVATAEECLTFAWNLPVSLIVSGVDSVEQLVQNVKAAQSFKPMSEEERSLLLEKTKECNYQLVEYYKK